jgi:hypothetical protein
VSGLLLAKLHKKHPNEIFARVSEYTVCYCRTQETPGAPEDTRGNKEANQRDQRAQRHHEDRRAQKGIGGDTKRTGGNKGGIGAGRKATWIQHTRARVCMHVDNPGHTPEHALKKRHKLEGGAAPSFLEGFRREPVKSSV